MFADVLELEVTRSIKLVLSLRNAKEGIAFLLGAEIFRSLGTTPLSGEMNVSQKNPRAHKNKIGTPPPPKNPKCPKTRNFMDMGFSCRKSAFFQASIKLTHPFPAQNCGQKFCGHEDFSEYLPPP